MLLTALAAVALGLTGCPRNVPQDSQSGKDAKHQGAKKIELDSGEGRVRGIVTYPGSDRTDWKVFEIPEGQQGDIKLRLSWRPARPGMDLSFNLYDAYFERLHEAEPSRSGRRSKQARLKGLKAGKYYIQIYASTRGDAGRYTMSVAFRERKQPRVPTIAELSGQIPDPPTLPEVIEPKVKTPEEIAAEEEARRLAEEEANRLAQEKADSDARTAELRKPVFARIRRTQESSGGGVIITINAGRNKGIDKTWAGNLLRRGSREPLPDGDFKVIRVTARESVARVQLSMDQVKANSRVVLRRTVFE
ncbi:MAG: hypothetical protein AAGC55_19095 [Myxococcota bacterium]